MTDLAPHLALLPTDFPPTFTSLLDTHYRLTPVAPGKRGPFHDNRGIAHGNEIRRENQESLPSVLPVQYGVIRSDIQGT